MLLTIRTWFDTKNNPTDWLARYAESGDRRDLERVFARYGNDLFHYLLVQSHRQCALDISQQTWLTVMEKRHTYRDQGQPKAWLFQIARNLLLTEWRKTRQATPFDEQLHSPVLCPDDDEALEEGAFNEALMRLSFVQREALTLQQEGFSLREIADITDASEETVKTRLRYAKNNLKHIFGADHE